MKHDKILNLVLAAALLILIIKINRFDFLRKSSATEMKPTLEQASGTPQQRELKTGTHQSWVSLTVAESKRLIARGLAVYPPVQQRLKNGTLVLTKGTTNTYVAEELLNDSLIHGEYVLGYISPAKSSKKLDKRKSRKELVFVNGELLDTAYTAILPTMKAGDIVIKGANIMNHEKGQAAVLIGHPTGGTTGNIYPVVQEKKLRLIIPVGLEKESSQDIAAIAAYRDIEHEDTDKHTPKLWPIAGELFTEIEALKQFADVEVIHFASGGIGGAEGAVSLLIRGSEDEVNKALKLIESVQGEAPFIP